ncbi:MAG: dihydrolipoyl dehydrogenase [Candidatus Omnitrophica bacterium]|nr:dihydrolipoyl dehydrogenase [Candidatus Omnitrophota bacterium]
MYDLTVIGAGWAGFNAGIKAKELGLKVSLIEESHLGGTCLNLGCIPTKTLIQSAKVLNLLKKSSQFGINNTALELDFLKIQERKKQIVKQLAGGMQSMLKGIDYICGKAEIISVQELKVNDKIIKTKYILIASGSKPVELKEFKFSPNKILSSNEILNLEKLPCSLLIIGGGVIGCEFASLFSILGTQVTLVEKMPQLLLGEDREVAKKLEGLFKKKGIKVNTDSDAANINLDDFELVLVCVGRQAQLESLGLEKIGLTIEKGRILVDDYLSTNINNIYAAGDCTAKICLAHYASFQGCLAAENIANPLKKKKAKIANIPNCIFTDPEIASVGLTESRAKEAGIETVMHRFDFMGSGMARILDETEGFLKIITDKNNGLLLGASIIGPKATELIGILTVAVSARLNIDQLRNTVFAHPSLSETIGEALK